jgi:hypothetical protein
MKEFMKNITPSSDDLLVPLNEKATKEAFDLPSQDPALQFFPRKVRLLNEEGCIVESFKQSALTFWNNLDEDKKKSLISEHPNIHRKIKEI